MFEQYSRAALQIIFIARLEAGKVGSDSIDTEHLLLGAALVDPATALVFNPSLSMESIRTRAQEWHPSREKLPTSMDLPLSDHAALVLEQAQGLANTHRASFVRTEHLLFALATVEACHAATILQTGSKPLALLHDLIANLPLEEQQEGTLTSGVDLLD